MPVLLAGSAFARRGDNAANPKESWTGLYFNGRKMGYTSLHTEPATYHGKQAIRMTIASVARLEMFGNKVSQDTTGTTFTDTTYRPLYSEYNISSNGSKVKIQAEYGADKIVCTVNSGGTPVKKVVAIPPGANLAADSNDVIQGKSLKVGQKMTYYFLEPLSVSLMKTTMEVQAEDEVKTASGVKKAFRVLATTPMGPMTSWQTASGDLLKGDLPLGMAMYGEPKEVARQMTTKPPLFEVAGASAVSASSYVPPKDFAQATAVTINRPIENPREVKSLTITISGIDDPKLIISDARQHAERVSSGANEWRMTILAKKFDPANSATLPITEPSVKAQAASAPYLETEDPRIAKLAAQLTGQETNAYKVAAAIREWVNKNMTPDYSIGVPRSCVEIFGKRRGVCRDYATLFAGIARAAGIPTRVCGGMVFAEGKFFYHAWPECWVGEWVPFDPTLKTGDFVDATHIKFAQGDVTDMFQVAGVVGRVKVTVEAVD
jgi:hypothetical protein